MADISKDSTVSIHPTDSSLRERKAVTQTSTELDIKQHEPDDSKQNKSRYPYVTTAKISSSMRSYIGPLLLTILSFQLRFHDIGKNNHVVWDEAHFGKFGSYYITHEFYHDVHPPLGKMLIALSEYLAGFDGHFNFDSNEAYPEEVNYIFMRQFNAMFGALCVPVTLFTTRSMGFNWLTSYLVTLMVTLEHSYIVLSKFILLDSILLFFTLTTFACMVKLYTLKKRQLTKQWSLWMLLTGLSVGCVCSVKWVGLFITIIVGLFTIMELFTHHYDKTLPRVKYYKHWMIRIIDLIIIPFLIYMFCFKIHFTLLYKSGTGDSATNTLFQVNLEGTTIENGPRDVMYGSEVTIRSHGLSPNLLHSHVQLYPDGSRQRQITGYGHSDSNNVWEFQFAREDTRSLTDNLKTPITDGAEIRLVHNNTRANLHSHEILSHVSKGNFEVSGYSTEFNGDVYDDWILEIVDQMDSGNPDFHKEDQNIVHPVSTFFRLRHKVLGCYLASTGLAYPSWGFQQAEIVCKKSWSHRDKATWWNVEDHWNDQLPIEEDYVPPKSKFWTDFILINFAMASSNSALVPDADKFDPLASKPWEWPTLHRGLRLCSWSRDVYKYYLLGSPFNTWLSTLSLFLFVFIISKIAYQWRRQHLNLQEDQLWRLGIQGIFPFLAWITHFFPFVMMGRVTYVHHYLPALYFAILTFGFVLDYSIGRANPFIKYPIYLALFVGCTYIYVLFAPICQGLHGDVAKYLRLEWLPTWNIVI
ncbi:hypothetical protein NCAS_0A07260 [Naumovozyma castellii]|uniref:Dolichyl-phosphate-mannose--protein mannosyltransferase n=1 Tax=Naumovozyma castellii TaxID=27288 RepID=G0V736_NAUCA|nr:hypothetical protein NCAS_0A07260 [Naumovozyma castellii CBS 4309]CCC67284.1 hypothetical protein NCAS_0A07260 [Naumovozyma castellii CBS 4309]